MKPIRVLIVEDSPVAREFLVHIFSADPDIVVVGVANNGEDALMELARCNPDVVTMDVVMPRLDGFETTRRIMETSPLPIIIVTASHKNDEATVARRALEVGAVATLHKPHGPGHPQHQEECAKLIQTVKLMAEVKVVRRFKRHLSNLDKPPPKPNLPLPAGAARSSATSRMGPSGQVEIVAIGASTGGPQALQELLLNLVKPFPAPIVIVQHIATGFLPGMVDWLGQSTGHALRIATHQEPLQPGHIYLAPDHCHLGVKARGRLTLSQTAPDNGLRPSVAHLFRTVAAVYGANVAAVLLTGMGKDGAAELKLLRDAGALTFAQDEESCIVYGMPAEAARLAAAKYVLPPGRIAAELNQLVAPNLS